MNCPCLFLQIMVSHYGMSGKTLIYDDHVSGLNAAVSSDPHNIIPPPPPCVNKTSKYDSGFYKNQWRKENASIILSLLMKILPKINSAVDFGCGLGSWLAVLRDFGIEEIKGYDMPFDGSFWAENESLEIPKEYFVAVDLNKKIALEKRYDLAISVEVAEHLLEKSSKIFVETLTEASDIVLFSAAIPYQGGKDHMNEQWQSYWYDLFYEFGYVGIDIRSLIWNDNRIKTWYKQNMILYVKKERIREINIPDEYYIIREKYLNIIHPDTYMNKVMNSGIQRMPLIELYKILTKRTVKRIIGKKNWEYLKKKMKQKNATSQ